MAFSSNGKFGHIDVDDVTYLQDTWYNLAQVGAGLSATVEINAVNYDAAGGQRFYVGILPSGGTAPTNLTTLGDLEVIEWYTKLVTGTPFVRNALMVAAEESIYVYSDNVDVQFRAHGMIRSEA